MDINKDTKDEIPNTTHTHGQTQPGKNTWRTDRTMGQGGKRGDGREGREMDWMKG